MGEPTTMGEEQLRADVHFGPSVAMKVSYGVLALGAPVAFVFLFAATIPTVLLLMLLGGGLVYETRRRTRKNAALVFDADGISVDGKKRIDKKDILSTYPDSRLGRVSLLLRGSTTCDFSLPDATDRARVLEHLGQTLEHQALRAPLRGQLGAFTRGLLSFLVGLYFFPALLSVISTKAALLGPLFAVVFAAWFVKRFGSPEVIVGAEGIRVVGRLFPRFVPYSRIVGARILNRGQGATSIVVELGGGKDFSLPTVAQSLAQNEELVNRIREGKRRFDEAEKPPIENFDRAGRSIKEWREQVAEQARGGGFRVATVDPRHLEQLVSDPSATLDRRVGAALALREVDPEAPARIRVSAERAADEHVRLALEEAAADDVDEKRLDRALRAR